MSIGAIIAVLAIFSGGATIAAQTSLPGDALYSVKVNVNERVRAALALTERGRADVAVKQSAERLEEAEELSAREAVSADVRAQLEENFQAFADRAEVRIDALADADARAAADVASNLEIALRTHEKVLANLSAVNSEFRGEVSKLGSKVSAEARQAAQLRAQAEAKVRAEGNGADVKTAAEGKLNAATNVIAAVRRFLNANQDRLTADESARAEAQVKAAENLVAQGEAKVAAGVYAEAFNLGNAAIRTAQGVHLLVDIQEELETDVEESVEVEMEEEESPRPSVLPVQSSDKAEVEVELRLNF
jgi:glycine cleavage system regulatory protein